MLIHGSCKEDSFALLMFQGLNLDRVSTADIGTDQIGLIAEWKDGDTINHRSIRKPINGDRAGAVNDCIAQLLTELKAKG